jgi:OOP family OmpA-OmpF porin
MIQIFFGSKHLTKGGKIMKCTLTVLIIILGMIVPGFMVTDASAAEIITEEDMIQNIITEEQLVRLADNFIVLFDASSSMDKPYKDTNMTRYDVAKKILKERNDLLPELGYNAGVYLYTPWKEIYPVQPYDTAKVASAIDSLPAKADNPTMLQQGLYNLAPVLQKMSGKTKVFIFTDGTYTEMQSITRKPGEIAKDLADTHDVSFYLISYPRDKQAEKVLREAASVDIVSRVIPFEQFVDRPESITNILYTVKATERIETITETKIVGIKIDNMLFDFNLDEPRGEFQSEIDELGEFLKSKANAYAVMAGYTDSVGSEEYNLGLSRRRAESVANYLMNNHNIDRSRIVMNWYGKANPIASNDTEEGRSMNRRVECAVGLSE